MTRNSTFIPSNAPLKSSLDSPETKRYALSPMLFIIPFGLLSHQMAKVLLFLDNQFKLTLSLLSNMQLLKNSFQTTTSLTETNSATNLRSVAKKVLLSIRPNSLPSRESAKLQSTFPIRKLMLEIFGKFSPLLIHLQLNPSISQKISVTMAQLLSMTLEVPLPREDLSQSEPSLMPSTEWMQIKTDH